MAQNGFYRACDEIIDRRVVRNIPHIQNRLPPIGVNIRFILLVQRHLGHCEHDKVPLSQRGTLCHFERLVLVSPFLPLTKGGKM